MSDDCARRALRRARDVGATRARGGSRSRSSGVVIAVAWIVIAIFAPLIAPDDPLAQTLPGRAEPVAGTTSSAPTSSAATSSAA